MSKEKSKLCDSERWAHFRFSVIGSLLAAPPKRGELKEELAKLAAKKWRHPIEGAEVTYGVSTIERWFCQARKEARNPVEALMRKIRSDNGCYPSLSLELRQELIAQYEQHPSWSYQLHADNLAVLVEENSNLGKKPSYSSVRRYMQSKGLFKRPRRGPANSPGAQKAEERFASCEVRSYEAEYVNELWHLDFHHGSMRVLDAQGAWVYPLILCILDDRSRLCCHCQWYYNERAQELCHGLSQALQKRNLPRAIMSDNGSAMRSDEYKQGLARLAIVYETTLAFSPYQNGKQEAFWAQLEGRLLAMLEGISDLTLKTLNQATQAWIEMEYNRKVHSETGRTPIDLFLNQKDVGRPCPEPQKLQEAFMAAAARKQRRSDGTTTIDGVRFEIPARYGHLVNLTLRYAHWDLSRVFLTDPKTGALLCHIYPLDKKRNASGRRAPKSPLIDKPHETPASSQIPPLLKKLIKQHAATGLPPAYLPTESSSTDQAQS